MIKFVRLPAVMAATGLNRSTLYEMIDRNEFPRPVKIGRRAIAWPEHEIDEWAQAQLSIRDAGPAPSTPRRPRMSKEAKAALVSDIMESANAGESFTSIASRLGYSRAHIDSLYRGEIQRRSIPPSSAGALLSVRALNAMRWHGIDPDDLESLRSTSRAELLRTPNLGRKTMAEIEAWIERKTAEAVHAASSIGNSSAISFSTGTCHSQASPCTKPST